MSDAASEAWEEYKRIFMPETKKSVKKVGAKRVKAVKKVAKKLKKSVVKRGRPVGSKDTKPRRLRGENDKEYAKRMAVLKGKATKAAKAKAK